MCGFPSWIEGQEVFFLTDKEAKEHFTDGYDAVGHSAIRKVFPKAQGIEKEGFVGVPLEFMKAINEGKCNWMMTANGYKRIKFNENGLHCEYGPAVERSDGRKHWYRDGKLHREDGPAIEWSDGRKHWYRDGKLHREDGPAIEWSNGNKWWYRDGKLHREDGPAVERSDGRKHWCRDGKLHREDGPAVEWSNGTKWWYRDGKQYWPK